MELSQENLMILKLNKMSKTILFIFIIISSSCFSQELMLDINILDTFKNEVVLSNFQIKKFKKIHSVKKLKKNRVFEFSIFFCNKGQQLINFNLLPRRISIKYCILESKDNVQNEIKTYLHCFTYTKEKAFFENCKDVSLKTDCFSFFKSKSKFYYIGNISGFQNSVVFQEKTNSD